MDKIDGLKDRLVDINENGVGNWDKVWCEGYICASCNYLDLTPEEEDELMNWLETKCE